VSVVSSPDAGPGRTAAGDPHVLDNPALASLTGPHARFAERRGRVLRYPVDVSPWLALPDDPDERDWADLAALAGPGAEVPLPGFRGRLPAGWEVTFRLEGVQLVDDGLAAAPDAEAVRLGPADVPEMLDLVARTRPRRSAKCACGPDREARAGLSRRCGTPAAVRPGPASGLLTTLMRPSRSRCRTHTPGASSFPRFSRPVSVWVTGPPGPAPIGKDRRGGGIPGPRQSSYGRNDGAPTRDGAPGTTAYG
jgi:hypothetical protein